MSSIVEFHKHLIFIQKKKMLQEMRFDEWKIASNGKASKWSGKRRKWPTDSVLTSVSDGQAAASWPCTGCLPAAGLAVSLASPGCHSNDT